MTDLSTTYLGLKLKNPLIVGSSELTNSVDKVMEYEKAGAGAVILKSLFEEQILMDIDAQRVNNMSGTYDHIENYLGFYLKKHSIDQYLKLITDCKKSVQIPVIASLNCFDDSAWIEFAKQIEKAGADAIELNIFVMPSNPDVSGAEMEQIYLNIVEKMVGTVKIPISVKLSAYFSGMAHFMVKLSKTGIKGITLFNRFYSPTVDIDSEKITSGSIVTQPADNANTLRWMSILSENVSCDLSASTGIHSSKDLISNLLVGANTAQMVSSIWSNGSGVITQTLQELNTWMVSKSYSKMDDFRGKLNQKNINNPMMLERAQFMRYFSDAGR